MTQQAENALHRQIKGVTWSVIITIVTTFCGGLFIGVRCYVGIITAIENNHKDYELLARRVDKMEERQQKEEDRTNELIAQKK